MRAEHIVFTVPRTWVIRSIENGEINNLDQVLSKWDEIIVSGIYNSNGLTVGNTDLNNRAPDFPERFVLDSQLEGGVYIRQGEQPIYAQNDRYWFEEWTNLDMLKSGQSWGTLRAIGVNYTPLFTSPWWGGLADGMANIYAFKVAAEEGTVPTLGAENGVQDIFPVAVDYASKEGGKYFNIDEETDSWIFQLTPFIQLFHQISNPETGEDGWGLYPYLLEKISEANINPADRYKRDFFYMTVSEYTQKDFASFFDAWGIQISDYARANIRDRFELLEKALWEYNPVTGEDGDREYVDVDNKVLINRTNWSFYSAATEPSEGSLAALKDSDPTTFWHSCWSSCTDEQKNPPHTIDVNMTEEHLVSGIMISSRMNSRHPKSFELYISDNGYDWEYVNTMPMEDTNYKQFLELPQERTFQHFRLVFKEIAYDDSVFAAISEIGAYSRR